VDAPMRTRSLMQSGKAKVLVYTACGSWMICGFLSGRLQIWNHASLTLVKTLSGHTESVNDLVASPFGASYPARVVSCGMDQSLRVWHSSGWLLEQHIHDTRCDRKGVIRCAFSNSGNWFMSVAAELSIWRVNITCRGRFQLSLHQRLANVSSTEGLKTSAFGVNDVIAAGSRDGVLGLWVKHEGAPPFDPAAANAIEELSSMSSPNVRTTSGCQGGMIESRPMRPMHKVTQSGEAPRQMSRGEWFQRSHTRALNAQDAIQARTAVGGNSAASASGKLVCNSPGRTGGGGPPITRTATLPDLSRLRAQADRDTLLASLNPLRPGDGDASPTMMGRLPSMSSPFAGRGRGATESDITEEEAISPMRKNMQRALNRGLVKRITLDAKVINDHSVGGASPTAA